MYKVREVDNGPFCYPERESGSRYFYIFSSEMFELSGVRASIPPVPIRIFLEILWLVR